MNAILKYAAFAACLLMVSCDFLDRTPDNRTEIDTKQKVQQLLVSGYSQANYGMMAELSGDNIVDNNAPDAAGAFERLSPMSRIFDEAFAWDDIVSGNTQDSPFYVWNYCYKAIATANAALEACDRLEKEGEDMNAERGEALLIRAYHHFVLVNIFAQHYKDSVASLNDLGITYMTELENTVAPKYERLSVTETYEHIVSDFEAGIDLVDESYYSQMKYHFNINAAHAFGARLYLYLREWDKVIEHANAVLGEDQRNAANLLFNATGVSYSQPTQEIYAWIDSSSPANLLLLPTTSWWNAYSMVPDYSRYAFNGTAESEALSGPWGSNFRGYTLWLYDQSLGVFPAKFMYIFEYSDKVAMTGYAHSIRREFTTNETLLCRAEAYIYKGELSKAATDMCTWAASYGYKTMTENDIKNYRGTKVLNNQLMSSKFTIPADGEPYVQSVLQCRRVETLLDGLRWFDLKRYGIEVTHRIGDGKGGYVDELLTWNDERRALQLPQEAIVSGMVGNRQGTAGNTLTDEYRVPGYASDRESEQTLREKAQGLVAVKAPVADESDVK